MRGDAGTEGSQAQERELLPGRRDRALASAVVETCATGTSARKARRIAERMGVGRLSKDQAGAITRSLDAGRGGAARARSLRLPHLRPEIFRRSNGGGTGNPYQTMTFGGLRVHP